MARPSWDPSKKTPALLFQDTIRERWLSSRVEGTLEVCMGADVVERRMRFQEKIMRLIQKKTREGSAEILRAEVEVLGAVLGLAEEEACSEFLSLRGVLWDVRGGDLLASMTPSAKGENPPRNWFAFTGVYLM